MGTFGLGCHHGGRVIGRGFGQGGLLEFLHLGRRVFTHMHRGVDDAQDEDGRANVERPFNRVGYLARGGHVGNADGGKQIGEHITHQRTGVAEEALNAVGLGLLALVHHVAHHHLERLHGHIDARVEEHQGHQAECHGRGHGEPKRPGVGQQAHHQHCHKRARQQVGDAPAKPSHPRLVAAVTHQRLYNHAHQRRQNPEVTQVVRVGAQCGKDAADVGTLQGVGNLHAKKTCADVPQHACFQIGFRSHLDYRFGWFIMQIN